MEYYEDNPAVHLAREILREVMNIVFTREAWIHDLSNNRWYVNDKYASTFGIDRLTYWHPVNLYARFPPEDVAKYVNNDLKVLGGGVPVTLEEEVRCRITDPDCQEYVKVMIRKTPIEADGAGLIFGQVLESLEDTQF